MTVDAQEWPECPECDGSGFTMLTCCCGYALSCGACCGNGIDDKEPCEFCQGSGFVPPERL